MATYLFQVLSILGSIGFVVAGVLAILGLRDYWRPLRLLVTYRDCQPTGNGTSLILLRLSFVNPASQGRTVYGLNAESKMSNTHRIELNQEVDSNLQNVTYSLPNVSRQLPFAGTLQFPLDIPPNQSLSRWLAIGVAYPPDLDSHFGIYVHMQATRPIGLGRWRQGTYLGRHKKEIAKTGIVLFPAKCESKTVDIYQDLQEMSFVEK